MGLIHNTHYNKDQRLDSTGRLESSRTRLCRNLDRGPDRTRDRWGKDQRLDRTGRPETRMVGLGHVGIWTKDWTGPETECELDTQ